MSNISEITKEKCAGCGACEAICKQNAIVMKSSSIGFDYPCIDSKKCIDCGMCSKVCPVADNTQKQSDNRYYAAEAIDNALRMESSSGGVFSLLATKIINEGGCVVGASLHTSGRVEHVIVDKIEDLSLIRKTKYVQSSMKGIYEAVMERVNAGQKVMFVGTPCQTEAMRLFSGKKRNMIYLVDLICYGVPSPGIFHRYVKYLEKKYDGKFVSLAFRDKRNKDEGHTAAVTIGDKEYAYSLYSDKYCKTYFKNINIRESCFSCNFTTTKRNSDITLGDFWGIDKVDKDFNDKCGVSLVITHNEKGEKLLSSIGEQMECFECSEEEAIQPRLVSPTMPHPKRSVFLKLYRVLPFELWLKLASR